ncbi:MAG: hypothetical protein RL120_14580 [Gammaproteobacteria bacterium]
MGARFVFVAAFMLVIYSTGAAFIEGFVNYSSWHLIGEAEFIAYHQFITPLVLTYLVAPLLLGTVFSILLLWFRPVMIPIHMVWAVIALQAVVWISTVAIQLPIQFQLSEQGLSIDSIERLIVTNFWLRRIPYGICAGLFIWMAINTMGADTREH